MNGGHLGKTTRVKRRFLRELILELNLKSFTGKISIRGKAPEGPFILRTHLRGGMPTYCFLNIEGGVLTGSKCIEAISELFCVDCELYPEYANSTELLEDKDLSMVQTMLDKLKTVKEVKSLLTNPLTYLLIIRYSSSNMLLRGKVHEILEKLRKLSSDRAVAAVIRGGDFSALLMWYAGRLSSGVLIRYITHEQASFVQELITEEELSEVELERALEVVECTVYIIERSKLRKIRGG